MNCPKTFALLAGMALAWNAPAQQAGNSAPKSLVDSINPIIGAGSSDGINGKTFPGAATPFGLVQLSPDTITGGDNGAGYSYPHKSIEGFSFTHMSGVGWYGELGNFLVMPTTGPLKTERGVKGGGDGYRSRFSHSNEIAQAGYYAVTLDDSKIRAELTAAPRAGILPVHLSPIQPVAHPDRPGPARGRNLHPPVRQSRRRSHHRRLDEMPPRRRGLGRWRGQSRLHRLF